VNDTTLTPACPSPENNAGTVGNYGFCPEPTTTSTIFGTSTSTTTVSSSTTTTTLAGASEEHLGGGLTLSMKEGKPAKSKLKLRTIEALGDELTLGRGPGSADDPTLHGGRLLVFSSVAGAFVHDYPLDTTTGSWVPKRKKGAQVGYIFKGNGAIKKVTITDSRWFTAKGKGEALALQLGTEDPSPVGVILEIGEHRYCLQFTHALQFKPNKRYYAPKNAPPAVCPVVPD
jgi:hypothetical protein